MKSFVVIKNNKSFHMKRIPVTLFLLEESVKHCFLSTQKGRSGKMTYSLLQKKKKLSWINSNASEVSFIFLIFHLFKAYPHIMEFNDNVGIQNRFLQNILKNCFFDWSKRFIFMFLNPARKVSCKDCGRLESQTNSLAEISWKIFHYVRNQ